MISKISPIKWPIAFSVKSSSSPTLIPIGDEEDIAIRDQLISHMYIFAHESVACNLDLCRKRTIRPIIINSNCFRILVESREFNRRYRINDNKKFDNRRRDGNGISHDKLLEQYYSEI